MAIALNVTHTEAADGTFSGAGAIAWNAAHTAGFTGLTANALLLSDGTDLTQSVNLTWGAAAGQGLIATADVATTNVALATFTRQNNNAAVVKGFEIIFDDDVSAAGFLPLNILGSATGLVNLLSISKTGNTTVGAADNTGIGILFGNAGTIPKIGRGNNRLLVYPSTAASSKVAITSGVGVMATSDFAFGFGSSTDANAGTFDSGLSRISAGVIGVGTGAVGNSAGTIQGKHNSSDGSAGVSGTGTTITCKDGIITAIS